MKLVSWPGRASTGHATSEQAFRHTAMFYEGLDGFVRGTSAFIADSIRANEPVLVVVDAVKIGMLRATLPDDGGLVRYADMAEVGRNPARIIPAWHDFVDEHALHARRFRGIGEPIWAERGDEELVESQRHEALLNLAFRDSAPWWLLCPYDIESLDPSILEEARRSHPFVMNAQGGHAESDRYRGEHAIAEPFDHPLSTPPPGAVAMRIERDGLSAIRAFVATLAFEGGLDASRTHDLVVAVNELATNSLVHGREERTLHGWVNGATIVCEVADRGTIRDPLVGRRRPAKDQESGYGVWLANQLCDLVQVRSRAGRTIVRVSMSR